MICLSEVKGEFPLKEKKSNQDGFRDPYSIKFRTLDLGTQPRCSKRK